jgi:hypothetical protein
MMTWTRVRRVGTVVACLALAPLAAVAQESPATPPVPIQPSKLAVQQAENGWLAAPDIKFARIAGDDAVIAGGYGGWVTDRTPLVGGGAYWLANGREGVEMAYGGMVLEWLARPDRRLGFGARALVGGGEATIPVPFARLSGPMPPGAGQDIRFGGHHHGGRPDERPVPDLPYKAAAPWTETFFIAEPQVNALLNVSNWCRINVGVGYRLIGGASAIDDQLRGVSGTIAVQFGGGR